MRVYELFKARFLNPGRSRLVASIVSITIYATLSRSIIIPTYDLGFDIYIGFIPIPTIYVFVQPIIVLFIIKLAMVIDLLVVINMASILIASYHLKARELGIWVIALSMLSTSGCCAGPPLIFLIAPGLSRPLGYGIWIYVNIAVTSLLLLRSLKIRFTSGSRSIM